MNIRTFVNKKSPEILLGLSIAGYIGSMIVVSITSTKLERKRKIINNLKKKERIAVYFKAYGPSLAIGALTISAMIGGHKAHLARTSSALAMYQFVRGSLEDHKNEVFSTLGQKKAKLIEGDISEKRMRKVQIPDTIPGNGTVLCFDDLSGRYFFSEMEILRKSQNDFNKALIDGEQLRTLNDLYYELGLPSIALGSNIGWEVGSKLVDMEFDSKLTINGKPCLVVRHKNLPNVLW